MFVLVFYILSPVPSMVSRRYADTLEQSSALVEFCHFMTSGIVVSAYGLPIILAHTPLSGPVVTFFISLYVFQLTCTITDLCSSIKSKCLWQAVPAKVVGMYQFMLKIWDHPSLCMCKEISV